MRRLLRPLAILAGGLCAVGLVAAPAFAAAISDPPSDPYTVPNDASGFPDSFNFQVTGFPPNTNVNLVQCDGVDPATPGWTPSIHCDFNTNPPPRPTDASGTLTIPAHSPFSFLPARGALESFNCLAPGDPDPNNGNPSYTNCRLRADLALGTQSSNQSFRVLTLQPASGGGEVPEVPIVAILPLAGLLAGGGYFLIRKRRHARPTAA